MVDEIVLNIGWLFGHIILFFIWIDTEFSETTTFSMLNNESDDEEDVIYG